VSDAHQIPLYLPPDGRAGGQGVGGSSKEEGVTLWDNLAVATSLLEVLRVLQCVYCSVCCAVCERPAD